MGGKMMIKVGEKFEGDDKNGYLCTTTSKGCRSDG